MLKETIVLNEKTKEDFKFEIKTSAKEVKLNDDKSVSFYDENANELYRISAPYMTDAIGEYSTAIDVDLKESQNGYLLKLKPNEEWLYDEKREYPIKIDPTMFKAYIQTIAEGSKKAMHYQQHRLLIKYYSKVGRLPLFNKSFW